MTRGILIAGNESSLSIAIAKEAAKRVNTVAMALMSGSLKNHIKKAAAEEPATGAEGRGPLPEGSTLVPIKWNAGSPLSSRTLLLQVENRLGQINDAVLICNPPAIRKQPYELSPGEIEAIVNDEIKSWFSLIREICMVFHERGSGCLAMVVNEINSGTKEDLDIAGPPAQAAFRAFAQGVLLSSVGEPYQALGFSTSDAGNEEDFAAHIFKIIDEGNKRNSGKWHKFGKLNIFR